LRRLESLSEARGESVNTTILRLLEETLGIHQRRERLRRYATWTDADQAEFEVAFEAQRTIDEALWR
jgi:hypothetical protein